MSALKYALAMLGAGGAMGLAGEAAATTIVPTPVSATSSPVDIALEGGPAQFYYGVGMGEFGPKTFFGTNDDGYVGVVGSDNTMPAADEVFRANDRVKTATVLGPSVTPFFSGDAYVHLAFNANGNSYVGLGHVDSAANLVDITYDQVDHFNTAVPEPATWALMIGGFGLAGATLRSRCRQALSA
jgi:hypothetical protein